MIRRGSSKSSHRNLTVRMCVFCLFLPNVLFLEWAFRLVGSQDLKFKGDREQSATLLDYGRFGDLYFAEYRVYKPLTDENVHLFTAAGCLRCTT